MHTGTDATVGRALGPVLVTGAAGFIGSHLTERLLAGGLSVVGLDNFCDFYDPHAKRRNLAHALDEARFQLLDLDIRDRQAVLEAFAAHRPVSVVHLAAMAGVRPSIERAGLYVAVNLEGTVNVLDGAVAQGCRCVLFGSSSSVYGTGAKVPFAEDDAVDEPMSPYAATKRSGELLCRTYWHLHELPIFCLRFFTVFGPRQRPDLAISSFLRSMREDRTIRVFGDGTTSRDYTYVDDVVSGMLAALNRCDRYRIYNLGHDEPVTLAEMIRTIERVTGRSAHIERCPVHRSDMQRTWADLTRSSAELGYRPAISLAQGIARQWQWLNQQAD